MAGSVADFPTPCKVFHAAGLTPPPAPCKISHVLRVIPHPVRVARAKRDLTQEDLARLARVNPSTIIRAEKGNSVSILTQERIARALGVPREELFPLLEEVAS